MRVTDWDDVPVLEASDDVGGRVRSDVVDGFVLDRGFQVLNTAYPAVSDLLDLNALGLHAFSRSALLYIDGRLVRIADPRQQPATIGQIARAPIGSLRDKVALSAYAASVTYGPVRRLLKQPDRPAGSAGGRWGISDQAVDSVLRPFFAGVFLETEMSTSSRFANLMMRMFARGDSALPTMGMQAIGRQIAQRLHEGSVHLDTQATDVAGDIVTTDRGTIHARTVVVATAGDVACELLPGLARPVWKGLTTVYDCAPESPLTEPTLVVDSERSPINNSVVLTEAAPSYSTSGRALIATTLLHSGADHEPDDAILRGHLERLYSTSTSAWERVAAYRIPHALPAMPAPHEFRRTVRCGPLYVCGDHRDTSSIQGALVSGGRAAKAVLDDCGLRSSHVRPQGR